jgi:hypothetical protein
LPQYVQHIAILIHGSPQIMICAIYFDEYFIGVPLVAMAVTPPAQSI